MKIKPFILLLLLGLSGIALAVPAPGRPMSVTQPDGSVLTVIVHGDERLSWITTVDGYSIRKNADGYFEYVKRIRNGKAVLSGIRATEPKQRLDKENAWLNRQPKHLKGTARPMGTRPVSEKQPKGQVADGVFWQIWSFGFASIPDFKGLLVPVNFADYELQASAETLDSMMNCPDYANGHLIGSVHDYYRDMSQGKFDFKITVLPPFTVNGNRNSYGTFSTDIKYEVLDYVKSILTDEQQAEYDRNGDGEIDHISVVFAGHGQEFTGDEGMIWSHNTIVDATSFSCIAEIDNYDNLPGIETYCHEFGHVLGLADHYDIDYDENGLADHPAIHDLMSSNTATGNPVPLSAFSRFILGWNALKIIRADDAGVYHLPDMLANNYDLRINTQTPGEFFVLENRSTKDKWQRHPYLGHGLLIFRVDSTQYIDLKDYDMVNHDSLHLGYALMRADNSSLYTIEDIARDYFPHGTDYPAFTDETAPSARALNGMPTALPLTDITEENDSVAFTFVTTGQSKLIAVTGVARPLDTGWLFDVDGEVILLGEAVCQEKGICFGLNPAPTVTDHKAVAETESLSYTVSLDFSEWFKPGTTVYLCAYALDEEDAAVYGAVHTLETYLPYYRITTEPSAFGEITIRQDGQTYPSGSWFKEGSELQLSAVPHYRYIFKQWMDGDTNNPRTLILNRDTTFSASFASITGTETMAQDDRVSIYPNPVEDRLHIVSPVLIHRAVLTDMKGETLWCLSDFRKTELSLANRPAGTYLLVLQTDKGMRTIKIVKP